MKKEAGTKATAACSLLEDEESPAESLFTSCTELLEAFRVSVEQILARGYSLEIKNPHDTTETQADSDELLADHQHVRNELMKALDHSSTLRFLGNGICQTTPVEFEIPETEDLLEFISKIRYILK